MARHHSKLSTSRRRAKARLTSIHPSQRSPTPTMSKVTILPQNLSAEVDAGVTLLDAGEKAGVDMEAGCFNCSCGTCCAEIVEGMQHLAPPSPEELDVLDQWNRDPDRFRLTCCVKVTGTGDVTLRQAH